MLFEYNLSKCLYIISEILFLFLLLIYNHKLFYVKMVYCCSTIWKVASQLFSYRVREWRITVSGHSFAEVYSRTRRNLSIRSGNTWCGILGVPRKFRHPPTFALCKGALSFFSSMNDDVWMLALGTGGTVKGSIVASSPGERTHSAPQGRPSWNITAKQQTAFCRLYTVNFMPDFFAHSI